MPRTATNFEKMYCNIIWKIECELLVYRKFTATTCGPLKRNSFHVALGHRGVSSGPQCQMSSMFIDCVRKGDQECALWRLRERCGLLSRN